MSPEEYRIETQRKVAMMKRKGTKAPTVEGNCSQCGGPIMVGEARWVNAPNASWTCTTCVPPVVVK